VRGDNGEPSVGVASGPLLECRDASLDGRTGSMLGTTSATSAESAPLELLFLLALLKLRATLCVRCTLTVALAARGGTAGAAAVLLAGITRHRWERSFDAKVGLAGGVGRCEDESGLIGALGIELVSEPIGLLYQS